MTGTVTFLSIATCMTGEWDRSKRSRSIGYYTYVKSFVSLRMGQAAAVAYIMTAIVLLLVLGYQRALYSEVEY